MDFGCDSFGAYLCRSRDPTKQYYRTVAVLLFDTQHHIIPNHDFLSYWFRYDKLEDYDQAADW